jgi:hypothetical protein
MSLRAAEIDGLLVQPLPKTVFYLFQENDERDERVTRELLYRMMTPTPSDRVSFYHRPRLARKWIDFKGLCPEAFNLPHLRIWSMICEYMDEICRAHW